jgi:hypothetical protein
MHTPLRYIHAVVLACAVLVPAAAAAQSQGERDLAVVTKYTLTMPKYKQYLDAMVNIGLAAAKDSTQFSGLENSGELSLDQQIAQYDKIPAVRRALGSAGMSTRDFVLTQYALLQTGMAYGMMKQMKLTPDSVAKATKVSRTNLDFYAANEAELTRLGKEAEARVPKPARGESDDEGADADSASGE